MTSDRGGDEADAVAVLRVYHSAVVTRWRDRDRWFRRLGARITTVSPRRWDEGGQDVEVVPDPGEPLVIARTWGRHPYRFLSDPVPIWRVLRRQRFDVIDIHEEPASLAAAEVQLLAWLAGQGAVPFCLYSAQNIPKRYPIPFRWFERVALRRATAVHSCNEAVTTILRGKGFGGPVVNLGLGVDAVPSGSRPANDGTCVVGYVGRLEEYKGVQVLIDAVAQVDDVRLVVVGDGPHRARLEAQVRRLAIGDRVTFVGFAGPDDVQTRYADFDLVVVPSLDRTNWIEQFGRVPVEAMSAGVPVIVSDSGSLPEVVADAGVLVPPEDPASLADAIRNLRDDPVRRADLAELGRARADHFTWRAIAARQLDLYRSMIAGSRPPGS